MRKKSTFGQYESYATRETEKIDTMISVYQIVLKRIKDNRVRSKFKDQELIENIEAARKRAERTVQLREDIYNSLVKNGRSQYSTRYQENLSAINRLRAEIINIENDGFSADNFTQQLSKEEYIEYVLGKLERELSLIGQEKELLGLMTELVSYEAFKRESILRNTGPNSTKTLCLILRRTFS